MEFSNAIIVYVGDTPEYLAKIAMSTDSSATFIDHTNYHELTPGTYYTSLGDLPGLTAFAEVLNQATSIIYTPPEHWTDEHQGHSKLQAFTEDYLAVFSNEKNVEKFAITLPEDKKTMLALADARKTDNCQLWVAGCSITAGYGVQSTQRYGQLLANQLNLPVSFLAKLGASLTWASDQILRSDIRAGDIVVWGLSRIERFPYFKNNNIVHVTAMTYDIRPEFRHKVDISFLDSQQLIYQAVTDIHKVVNFCNKINAKLILTQLLGRGIENYLRQYPNYQMLYHQHGRDNNDRYIDIGNDAQHPGPLMHQWYSEKILSKYYQIYKDTK